ncbi:DNA repair protein RecO [Yoonia sp. BS5-3]|uniref:DNA repair protein RecO n=1 Tax=Yoonia phaeophyticola TaxID=3137369 RepID=A0ABZ2V6J0_9RHOB
MIEWRDEGAILATRPFGESAAIVELFSAAHGRHAGVVRGGASRKAAPNLQPGTQVAAVWKARLDDHLGAFTLEPLRSRAAIAMSDRLALAGLNAVCGLLAHVLPERAPYPAFYERTMGLLDLLGQSEVWPLAYLRWEQALLEEMGFGLDLSGCAVRGVNEDLAYVSPKSGRAVSRSGAGEWADRLLPLPPVLTGMGDASNSEIIAALGTTGFFIEHRLVKSLGDRPVPPARDRLLHAIARL